MDYDDDTSFDGWNIMGVLVALAALGLGAYLMFAAGNQQGITTSEKCMAQQGCQIVAKKGWLGVEYRAMEHVQTEPAKAESATAPAKRAP